MPPKATNIETIVGFWYFEVKFSISSGVGDFFSKDAFNNKVNK
jgi:hypothetical protein